MASIALSTPVFATTQGCKSSSQVPARFVLASPGVQTLVFAAKEIESGHCWHTNAKDVKLRHPPWSTFKIPHFLIALETGVVTSSSEVLRWNSEKRPAESYWPDAWKQDQSLASAFRVSAAWAFQELVPRIGRANYAIWLRRFQFGNTQAPSWRDDFWLGGPLAISASEQVAFLSCVATTGCGATAESLHSLEEVARQGESHGSVIYAKTGSGPVTPRDFSGKFEGWYVGYVRNAQGAATLAFATYVRSTNYASLRTYREAVSLHLLSELGFWHR